MNAFAISLGEKGLFWDQKVEFATHNETFLFANDKNREENQLKPTGVISYIV